MNFVTKKIVKTIFTVRWLLIPFYLGLVVVLGYYFLAFFNEIVAFMHNGMSATMEDTEMFALDSIDLVMVANLIKMIITGSINSFVTKDHGYPNEEITSGELKNKISTSIIVVAMVHLLKIFVADHPLSKDQMNIFFLFIFAALALAVIEFLHHKAETKEHH